MVNPQSEDCIPDVDYVEVLIEEIALEGLDGITVSALWTRLSHRPNFNMTLDDAARSFLWETIVHHPDLDFYILPQPRPPLVIRNPFENIDSETGLVLATQDSDDIDIYPFELVKEPGIFGSCATFHDRLLITNEIRPNQVSFVPLMEAEERYQSRLVLVASTDRRRRALMGPETNPNLQLVPIQYAMLERVGRTRYLGDMSVGQTVINSSAKTLFYHRKVLLKNNLVLKQGHYHYLKQGNRSILRNGMLFHLTRFFVEHQSKISLLYQELIKHLLTKPNRCDAVSAVLALLGINQKSLKKAFQKSLKKFAEIHQEPYRKWHPNSTPSQWCYSNKTEKMVNIIRLHDHVDQDSVQRLLNDDTDVSNELSKGNKCGEDDDEDDDDDDCQPSSNTIAGIPDQTRHVLDRSVLHQAYDAFVRTGTDGLSERNLSAVLGVPRLEGRSICRKLLRINAVTAIMKDRGRQKFKSYSAKCFLGMNEQRKEIIDECQKLLASATDAQMNREDDVISSMELLPSTTTVGTQDLPNTFLDDVRKMSESGNSNTLANSLLVTSRGMKRANLIVKLVRDAKLFDSLFVLQKAIIAEEVQENYRIDRKSLIRLINRLTTAGVVKTVKSVLTYGEHEKKVTFICDPTLKSNDPLVYSALENAKLKYFSNYRAQQQTLDKLSQMDPIHRSFAELRNLDTKDKFPKKTLIPLNGRLYGFEPKFVRMKLFHQYLFYLVFEYDGRLIEPSDPNYPSELKEFSTRTSTLIPPVYHTENTWKRFLPNVPQHTGWKSGWCLFSDVLLRLPLSLLTKLLNVNFKVEGLRDYLDHPILRHLPITHLPVNLRTSVLYARRYIYRLYDIATRLGYAGILSFNQPHKEKDHAFFYLHRKAQIVDTTMSLSGYVKITPNLDYPVKRYTFNTSADVNCFWQTLETICLATPLGSHPKIDQEQVTFDYDLDKKHGMASVLASKTDDDIIDDGSQPGDGLGAGGLDSAFFAHLKRNWSWVSIANDLDKIRAPRKTPVKKTEVPQPSLIAKFLLAEGNVRTHNPRRRLTRLAINNQLLSLTSNKTAVSEIEVKKLPNPVPSPARRTKVKNKKSRSRKCKIRRTAPRRPYYDAVDTAALKLMTKSRATWSTKEDSLLLLTKVAAFLLDGDNTTKHTLIPFSVVRDFLHSQSEESKSKTSRACQRRMRYMMIKPETVFNVSVFVGESKDDPVIREICDKTHEISPDDDADRKPRSDIAWKSRFEAIIERLLVKFKASASTNRPELFQLPDSIQQLESQYNVILSQELLEKKHTFTDVKNVVDIHFSIVYSLILSSVGSSKDGNSWSNLLYQIYQQYPESLLRSALAKLRSQLIVSKRKNVTRRIPKKAAVSLVTFPYQLSITYQNLFLGSFRDNVFAGANELMRSLLNDHVEFGDGVDLSSSSSIGCAAAVISLIHGKKAHFKVEIPENIIILNVDEASVNERGRQFLEKYSAWEAQKARQNSKSIISTNDDQPPMKKVKLDESETTSVNNTEMMDTETDPKETIMKMKTSSRFALYLLRTQMNETILSDSSHPHDYLVVNTCRMVCKLQSNEPEVLQKNVSSHLAKLTVFLPEAGTPINEVCHKYREAGLSDEVVAEMLKLFDYLKMKRELGAKYDEMRDTFKEGFHEMDLKRHLRLMQDHNLVLRVGLNSVRYVTIVCAKPWLLHSFNQNTGPDVSKKTTTTTDKEVPKSTGRHRYSQRNIEYKQSEIQHLKPVKCLCRPWRKPNGELNRPILNEILRSIMSHIMCFPGISYTNLCEKYAPVLSPVQIFELLEILEDADCVRRTFLKQSRPSTTLFDEPVETIIVDSNEDDAVVHLHAQVNCIIKLSEILYSD